MAKDDSSDGILDDELDVGDLTMPNLVDCMGSSGLLLSRLVHELVAKVGGLPYLWQKHAETIETRVHTALP